MKKKKSVLSILGVLLLSLTFASGASAMNEPDPGYGGSKPPTSCTKAPCPLP